MLNSHQNGSVSESIVLANLYRLGHAVSVPMVSDEPYDLVPEVDGELLKLQVKTMFKREGQNGTRYRVELRPRGRGSKARYSEENVDAFAIHDSYHDNVYWLWFDEAPKTEASRKLESWQDHLMEEKLEEYSEV